MIAAVGLGLVGVLGAFMPIGGAAFADPAVAQVRITMTDGVTAPTVGARLTYTITLVDHSAATIRMAAPDGLADLAVTAGSLPGRELTWSAPGGTQSVNFAGTVTGPSTRLATTACAYVDAGGRPIACASDLDQVVRPTVHHQPWALLLGGAFVLLTAITWFGIAWRRRRPIAVPKTTTTTSNAPATSNAPVVADVSTPPLLR